MSYPTTSLTIVGTALLPGGSLRRSAVQVAGGRITAVETEPTIEIVRSLGREGTPLRLSAHEVLAPAFVDIHCHGAGGGSAHGDAASLGRMARSLKAHGVGAFVATTLTASLTELRQASNVVASACEHQRQALAPTQRAQLLGLHLEGPALAPSRSAGHDQSALVSAQTLGNALADRPTDWQELRIVTLAPELQGGLRLVQTLADAGVIASLGHTDASDVVMTAAYAAGARSTTHLFNGMPQLRHRAPGPVGVALADAPFIELICDGIHVDDRLLAPVARAIGEERLILVSDALPLAGSRMRRVALPGLSARVQGDRVVDENGDLAGSRLLLDGMLSNAVRQGVPLDAALRAATENPARLLHLHDRGAIKVGAVADLVIVSDRGRFKRLLQVEDPLGA